MKIIKSRMIDKNNKMDRLEKNIYNNINDYNIDTNNNNMNFSQKFKYIKKNENILIENIFYFYRKILFFLISSIFIFIFINLIFKYFSLLYLNNNQIYLILFPLGFFPILLFIYLTLISYLDDIFITTNNIILPRKKLIINFLSIKKVVFTDFESIDKKHNELNLEKNINNEYRINNWETKPTLFIDFILKNSSSIKIDISTEFIFFALYDILKTNFDKDIFIEFKNKRLTFEKELNIFRKKQLKNGVWKF